MERCSLPSDIVLLRRLNTCYVRYSVSHVDCFHSLKEREREFIIISFCLGLSFLRRQKPKKKAKNGRTAVALVASSAVTSTPSITILSLDIDIARADATARSTRPPRNRTTRALCSRNVDLPFRLDVFASTQFAKPFPFFPRCFSRSKNGIPIQSALMMTQKCAHRIPLFLVDATDATDARLEKIDELLFTRAKRGWSEGKKEKRKSAAYHCFVLACEASK